MAYINKNLGYFIDQKIGEKKIILWHIPIGNLNFVCRYLILHILINIIKEY